MRQETAATQPGSQMRQQRQVLDISSIAPVAPRRQPFFGIQDAVDCGDCCSCTSFGDWRDLDHAEAVPREKPWARVLGLRALRVVIVAALSRLALAVPRSGVPLIDVGAMENRLEMVAPWCGRLRRSF